jgi:hypothetical protein
MHTQHSHAGRQKEWLPPYFSQRRRMDISNIFGETHRLNKTRPFLSKVQLGFKFP